MKRLLFIMFIIAATMNVARAQQQGTMAEIKGVLIDTTSNAPIVGAVVLVKGTQKGSVSDAEGKFNIKNLTINKEVEIEITYTGYIDKILKVTPTSAIFNLTDKVYLKPSNMRIGSVEVLGSAPTAVISGDTVQFNAGAYKTNPDATASDLLEKMPGFEKNDDGTVSNLGEKVQRIKVDGKDFFKNDAATALNALDADMIESIQMYDDKSDASKFTGYDDGTEIKTLNIITKRRIGNKPAYLFESTLGYGYDNVYQGNITYTKIEGDEQISVMGGMNNVNTNPIQQRRGFGRGNAGGINTQAAAAFNYSNKLKNDGEISVSYNFHRKETEKESATYRTYFPSAEYTDYTYNIMDSSLNITNTHRFSLDIKSNIGEKTQITFRPTGSYSYSDNNSNSYSISSVDGSSTINDRSDIAENDSFALSGDLHILRKITDKNFLTVRFRGNFNNSNNDTYILGDTYYDTLNLLDTIAQNQESNVFNNNNTASVFAEFTQRVSDNAGISLKYEFEYNWSENDRKTYIVDPITGEISDDLDPLLSNHFVRDYYTNTFSSRYNYNTDVMKLNVSAGYKFADLENEELYPDNDYLREYSFSGVTFMGRMKYQKNKQGGSLDVRVMGNQTYPSVAQLQDVMNTDNPLQLSSGNPNLEQGFKTSVRMRYRGANKGASSFYGFFGSFDHTLNGVVNSTTLFDTDTNITVGGQTYLAKAGSQYTTYANIDGAWSANIGGMYSFPIEFIKSKINLMGFYRYNNQPSLFNGEEYVSKSSTYTLRLGINSNISQNIDFNINNSASYQMTKSNMTSDNNFFTNNLRFNLYVNVWNNFFFSSDYTLRYQHLENTTLDEPFTNLVSLSIGKKFGKNNAYEIRANVYDLLNQNKNVAQQVSDIYVADVLSNDLTRYFALTFTYKFNSIRNMANKFMRGDMPSHGGGRSSGGHGGGRPY